MNSIHGHNETVSYFWDCLTLKEKCPFFATADPKLHYFGIGVACLYSAFFVIILADLNFYWSVNNFQRQLEYYTNLVRKKVRLVLMDQKRLMSTKERTKKQMQRSEQFTKVVIALRGASAVDHHQRAIMPNDNYKDISKSESCEGNVIEF